MTHKFFRTIFLLALFLVNKTIAQTGSGLDTLTQVNGWRLVKYAPGVTFARTWFSDKDAYHGRYSQIFEVDRNESNVAPQDYYYAIFKKNLKKRIKKTEFLQYSYYYAHSTPNVEGHIEIPLMAISLGNNEKRGGFKGIISYPSDGWRTFPILTSAFPFDSIDCVYLKVSGSFKVTVIQIDYLIFVNPLNGSVFAVIDDFEDATITDVEDELSIPTNYSLSQNYPNPFNPETAIKFQVPTFSHITLKIFDVLGREIETLVNEDRFAGEYTVKFSGLNLASGMYIYQLNVGNGQFVQTKKMILMK